MTLGASRLRLVAVGLVAFVLAAGCGGTSPLARSSSPTGPPTTAPVATGPSTTAPSTTAPPATAPSTSSPPTTVAPTTTAPTTPQETARARAVLNAAKRDGLAERWAHVRGTELVTWAGPDRGTQTVTAGGQVGLIRVLPNATYIQGSALALHTLFQVPAATATRVAGKWVILTRADPEYKGVTIGVTLASELNEVVLTGALRIQPYNHGGRRGTLITGSLPAQPGIAAGYGALLVTTGHRPLPEEYAQYLHTRQTVLDETFSLWGASELVKAPAGAVALPKVRR